MYDNHTYEDLLILQSLPLNVKVRMTQTRIREWVKHWGEDKCYISFSGGKDSTVLLHLVRELYPDIPAIFSNTGLEYPEIQSFAKSFDNVEVVTPKKNFKQILTEYGYPVISKEVSEAVMYARRFVESVKNGGRNKYQYAFDRFYGLGKYAKNEGGGYESKRTYQLRGIGEYSNEIRKADGVADDLPKLRDGGSFDKDRSSFNMTKWQPLLDMDFRISHKCCNCMKKEPLRRYQKNTKRDKPFLGLMTAESRLREQAWLRHGCNAFNADHPSSSPMSFWTEQDVLRYIKENNIPIAPVYGEIVQVDSSGNIYEQTLLEDGCKYKTTGCSRTGCIFCGFGAHLERGDDRRFVRLKKTHPKQYDYCMGGGEYDSEGLWIPSKEGLGLYHVFDELNKVYGKDFIVYE